VQPRRALALGLGFLASGFALAFAMAGGGCSHTAAPAPSGVAPIVIGVSFGLTGNLSSLAVPMQNGVRVAEAQINAIGGLFGRPVEFDVVDDKSASSASAGGGAQILGTAAALLDAGVVSVLGPIASQQVLDINGVFAANHIIEITSAATAIDLADAQPLHDRYLFRTVPSDDLQGKAIAVFASNKSGTVDAGGSSAASHATCLNMAIINASDAYGQGLYTSVSANMVAAGQNPPPLQVEVAESLVSDYTAAVNAALAGHPQCLGLFTYDDVGAAVVRQVVKARAQTAGLVPDDFFIVGSDGVFDQGFLTDAQLDPSNADAGNAADGLVFGTSPDSAPPTPEYLAFRDLYSASFPLASGQDTASYVSNTYDAAMLMILAIQQAGGVGNGTAIRDSLYAVSSGGQSFGPAQLDDALRAIRGGTDIDYDGASGNCDLDDSGNVITDYIVWKVQNGQFSNPPVSRVQATDLE
jgi:ABC-type branched-subunit amino acid transport system substrate-binding protein